MFRTEATGDITVRTKKASAPPIKTPITISRSETFMSAQISPELNKKAPAFRTSSGDERNSMRGVKINHRMRETMTIKMAPDRDFKLLSLLTHQLSDNN